MLNFFSQDKNKPSRTSRQIQERFSPLVDKDNPTGNWTLGASIQKITATNFDVSGSSTFRGNVTINNTNHSRLLVSTESDTATADAMIYFQHKTNSTCRVGTVGPNGAIRPLEISTGWNLMPIVARQYAGSNQWTTVSKELTLLDKNGNTTIPGNLVVNGKGNPNIFLQIYPVGAIYLSVNITDPGTLFGGTWRRMQDCFLWCSSGTVSALPVGTGPMNREGGSEKITLGNLPTHSHSININTNTTGNHSHKTNQMWYTTARNAGAGTTQADHGWAGLRQTGVSSDAGNHAHNVNGWSSTVGNGENYWQPYRSIYAWTRIS